MKRALLFILSFAAVAMHGADPYVGFIYPCGVQAGTTNRLLIGGQSLWNVSGATVSGSGVKVLGVELVPGFPNASGSQFRWLAKWLDGIEKGELEAPPIPTDPKAHVDEWRSNRWWRVLGTLDVQKRSLVEHSLYVRRNPLQASPSISQRMLVTVSVDKDAQSGPREFRVYGRNGISAPRPLIVTAELRSQEALYAPPHRPRPPAPAVTNLPCVLDGQIMPGQTDTWTLHLRKGKTVTLRTVARELQPYIGDAVPGFFNPALRIIDEQGKEVAFADDNYFHPDPVLVFTPPSDGDYKLEVHDVLYRGRADFVYAITVESGAHPVGPRKVGIWHNPEPRLPLGSPYRTFNGAVSRPGICMAHDFTVKKPGEYTFDLLARRAGSPLDGRISIVRANEKKPIAVFSDTTNKVFRGSLIQAECDPVGTLRLDAGKYTLRVEDEANKGGKEWSYELRVYKSAPSFEVWSAKSSISLRARGRSMPFTLHVIRHGGFTGPVRLIETDDFRFSPDVIPSGTNSLKVAIISKNPEPKALHEVSFQARARLAGGRPETVDIQPADEYNQAFAWNHLLPSRSFVIRTVPNPGKGNKKGSPGVKKNSSTVKKENKPKKGVKK